jgi:Zn-dependent protease
MKWSFRLGRIAGIDISVHLTFFLLIFWLVAVSLQEGNTVGATLSNTAFLLVLFGIVLLHELGHALTARRFGVQTRDIILLPIGGLARLERMPREPIQELIVALAGPMVNIVLGGLLFGVAIQISGGVLPAINEHIVGMTFLGKLVLVNAILAGFNLLPAFPMDGGRVLRAFLGLWLSYVTATNIAATVGRLFAIGFFLLGLSGNWVLMLIAVFVWFGAGQEAAANRIRHALNGVPVEQAMATEFHTVRPNDPVAVAVRYLLNGFQHEFPVEENGRLMGVLTRKDLVQALNEMGPATPVHRVMYRDVETAGPKDELQNVIERLQEGPRFTMPVVEDGHLVGLLTLENLNEFLAVRAALSGAPHASCPVRHETHPQV